MSPLDKKVAKSSKSYYCEVCDYTTSRKNNFDKHLQTKKHKKKCHLSVTDLPKKVAKSSKSYYCEHCNKSYKSRNGLWKHKKTCMPVNMKEDSKQPQVIQNIQNIQNLDKQINNHINVNLFLDTHCKNAKTLKDFVDSINLSLQDLSYTCQNGYLEGMSNILSKQLEDLSPTDRPIHSTDAKRLKFMVKNEKGWVKDDGTELDNVVTKTKFKLVNSLTDWEKENPDWNKDPQKLDTWQKTLNTISPEPQKQEKYNTILKKKLAKLASIKEAMKDID